MCVNKYLIIYNNYHYPAGNDHISLQMGKGKSSTQKRMGMDYVNFQDGKYSPPTLPETNSLPLKIGRNPRGNSSSNHQFSGDMLVSGRVISEKIGLGIIP